MSNTKHLYPVILAGGSGTRLWPLSTQDNPKQFLSLGQEASLIGQTHRRLQSLGAKQDVWVVCGKHHQSAVQKHLSEVPAGQILCEPMARNTAPAIAWAALQLAAVDPEAIMVVLPADHFIPESSWEKFAADIQLAAHVAATKEALVTLGIQPDHASTGFGYLEQGEAFVAEGIAGANQYFAVQAFHEKPDGPTAEKYLKSGRYYWNSGMFVWQARTFLNNLELHEPKMFEILSGLQKHFGASDFEEHLAHAFSQVEAISVDYAVMERAAQVFMIPAHFAWDDVGSLAALAILMESVPAQDPQASATNAVSGEVLAVESQGNVAVAKTKPIALVGVNDLIVVDAPQATLVLPKARAQEVKKMVELLKKQKREDLL